MYVSHICPTHARTHAHTHIPMTNQPVLRSIHTIQLFVSMYFASKHPRWQKNPVMECQLIEIPPHLIYSNYLLTLWCLAVLCVHHMVGWLIEIERHLSSLLWTYLRQKETWIGRQSTYLFDRLQGFKFTQP